MKPEVDGTGTRVRHLAACRFEAARSLEHLPDIHRARQLHGHSFLASVECDLPSGWAPFPGAEVATLRHHLQHALSPLDYRHLNTIVGPHPSDEAITRWLSERLSTPNRCSIGMQSTDRQGVLLQEDGSLGVWRRYDFQAAHQLPHVPAGHKCGRMHGHGFGVVLHARQTQSDSLLDQGLLDQAWAPVHARLDHHCLNELPGLDNPTSEVLAAWLWHTLQPELPSLTGVTVYETATCGAHFDGSHFRIWKDMSFDSACRLKHAPDTHPLHRLHGHTYTLRLQLQGAIDTVMGWLVDFGDVKTRFAPVFAELDHHALHELPGLDHCGCADLAQWIYRKGRSRLPQLASVDLYETEGCGVRITPST